MAFQEHSKLEEVIGSESRVIPYMFEGFWVPHEPASIGPKDREQPSITMRAVALQQNWREKRGHLKRSIKMLDIEDPTSFHHHPIDTEWGVLQWTFIGFALIL